MLLRLKASLGWVMIIRQVWLVADFGPFIYPSVPVGLGAPIRRVVALSCLRVTNTGSTAMARVSLYPKLVP